MLTATRPGKDCGGYARAPAGDARRGCAGLPVPARTSATGTSANAYAGDSTRLSQSMESLVAQFAATQATPSKEIDIDAVFKALTFAEATLTQLTENVITQFCAEDGPAFTWLPALCAWLRDHEDFPDGLCVRTLLKVAVRFMSVDPALDSLAIQRGILSSATNLLTTHLNDALMVKCCLEVVGVLSVTEGSDQIMTRLHTVLVILDVLQKYRDNTPILEDAITTLALMAKRTRHRRTLTQSGGVTAVVDILKKSSATPALVIATCRFLSCFAVKEECCLTILNSGGIDALLETFDCLTQAPGSPGSEAVELIDLRATVASTVWTCSIDCADAQALIFSSGWLNSLVRVLLANPHHGPLTEAALGIVRGLSRNSKYYEEVLRFGFMQIAMEALRNFGKDVGVLKEACGMFGNLATDAENRLQLGQVGAIHEILKVLSNCTTNDDRKVAKLALGAISNLALADENRELFCTLKAAPELLHAATTFLGNENIIEYAVGAISHIAVHHGCNQQLVDAGAVEALLSFLGDHRQDRDVVVKVMVALRRVLKFSTPAQDSKSLEMLRRIVKGGFSEGTRGLVILIDALKAHDYDDGVLKETCLLLTTITQITGLIPLIMKLAGPTCLKAVDVHHNDPAAAEALAGLLAKMPLEEEEEWFLTADI